MNKAIEKEKDMENKMFCYQCEQTAGCTGCTGNAGVCGKSANTARLQDEITGALIGLARAAEGNEHIDNKTFYFPCLSPFLLLYSSFIMRAWPDRIMPIVCTLSPLLSRYSPFE